MAEQTNNTWPDEVNNPKAREFKLWGSMTLDLSFCTFVPRDDDPKKKRKVAYNDQIHGDPGKEPYRSTEVLMKMIPFPELNQTYPVERSELVSEKGNWGKFIAPKFHECLTEAGILGADGKTDIGLVSQNHFARWIKFPTGEKYPIKKDGVATGELGDSWVYVPEKIFKTREECHADMQEVRGKAESAPVAVNTVAGEPPVNPNPNLQAFKVPLIQAINTMQGERNVENVKALFAQNIYAHLKFYADHPEFIQEVLASPECAPF